MIEIRNGAYCAAVILDRVCEWSSASWKSLMAQMAKGGRINDEAIQKLEAWFPGEIQDAKAWWDDAVRTQKREFRSYKETPRSEWEEQKATNAKLNDLVHKAFREYDILSRNYKHFLAAKASMKKEK